MLVTVSPRSALSGFLEISSGFSAWSGFSSGFFKKASGFSGFFLSELKKRLSQPHQDFFQFNVSFGKTFFLLRLANCCVCRHYAWWHLLGTPLQLRSFTIWCVWWRQLFAEIDIYSLRLHRIYCELTTHYLTREVSTISTLVRYTVNFSCSWLHIFLNKTKTETYKNVFFIKSLETLTSPLHKI